MNKTGTKPATFPDFQDYFGQKALFSADAPGRVNLIGEHTDYNGGLVLPTAIPQRTYVEAMPRQDEYARVWTSEMGGELHYFQTGGEVRTGEWLDYIKGITHQLRKAGLQIKGFDLLIFSQVPLGSGLSSSAALEISVLRVLRQMFRLELDDVQIALIGQKAENEFVGAKVGIMDQMASSLADEQTCLKIDTRTLQYEKVALPPEGVLYVIDSGIKHQHASGDYNQRRKECEIAAKELGVEFLTDLTPADLPRLETLAELYKRRARHVITENARVNSAVEAIRGGDLEKLGELFYDSHASMRDDYAVSIPEIDFLVELARQEKEIWGARLTGGGFGGSVVMLGKKGSAQAVENIVQKYKAQFGAPAQILVPQRHE